MTTRMIRRTALLSGSAAVLLITPTLASAQDALAVAERFTTLLQQTTEGAEVSYGAAASADGSVTLSDLSFTSTDEEDGSSTVTAGTAVIDAPVLGDGNLTAASITMTDLGVLTDDGSRASAASVTMTDVDMVPQDADYETRFGSVAVSDMSATGKDGTSVEVASLIVETGNHLNDIPTDINFSIEGVLLERGDMEGALDAMFDATGLDSMLVSVSGDGNWAQDAQQLIVDDFTINARDLGRVTLAVTLGGVTEQTFAQLESNPMVALSPLSLVSMSLDLEDGPLAETALAKQAENLDVSVDDLRTTSVVNLKQMLAFLGANPFRTQVEDAFESYIMNEKDGLTLTAAPAQPVPVMAVGLTAQTAPDSIPGLLNMTISAQ